MESLSSINITGRAVLPVVKLVYGDERERALSSLQRLART